MSKKRPRPTPQELLDAIAHAGSAEFELLQACTRSRTVEIQRAFQHRANTGRVKARLGLLVAAEYSNAPRGSWIDETIAQRLSDPNDVIRFCACDAITARRFCAKPRKLVEALKSDRSWIVRSSAAEAMETLRDDAFERPLLQSLARDRSYIVRRDAATTLRFHLRKAHMKVLIGILAKERESTVRLAIALTLAHLGDARQLQEELASVTWQREEQYGAALNMARHAFRDPKLHKWVDPTWFAGAVSRSEQALAPSGASDDVRAARATMRSLRAAWKRGTTQKASGKG